jgi:hypothetical protein
MNKDNKIKARLEYLRQELRAERLSYQEIAELQSLAPYIDKGDVELLEPAGVPEFEGDSQFWKIKNGIVYENKDIPL